MAVKHNLVVANFLREAEKHHCSAAPAHFCLVQVTEQTFLDFYKLFNILHIHIIKSINCKLMVSGIFLASDRECKCYFRAYCEGGTLPRQAFGADCLLSSGIRAFCFPVFPQFLVSSTKVMINNS